MVEGIKYKIKYFFIAGFLFMYENDNCLEQWIRNIHWWTQRCFLLVSTFSFGKLKILLTVYEKRTSWEIAG